MNTYYLIKNPRTGNVIIPEDTLQLLIFSTSEAAQKFIDKENATWDLLGWRPIIRKVRLHFSPV